MSGLTSPAIDRVERIANRNRYVRGAYLTAAVGVGVVLGTAYVVNEYATNLWDRFTGSRA